jgi:hypothetical protein
MPPLLGMVIDFLGKGYNRGREQHIPDGASEIYITAILVSNTKKNILAQKTGLWFYPIGCILYQVNLNKRQITNAKKQTKYNDQNSKFQT